MSRRDTNRGGRHHQRNPLVPFRLALEALETRRLLAGVQVSVYVDHDGSRSFDPTSDTAAPKRLVYVDLNRNAVHDTGEPVAVTGDDGAAFFADLESGDYSFGLIVNARTQPQVEPVGLGLPQLFASPAANQTFPSQLLATADLGFVWSLGADGKAELVSGPAHVPVSVQLGTVETSTQQADRLWAVVAGPTERKLAQFNLQTGQVVERPIVNAPAGAAYLALAQTSSDLVALLSGPSSGPNANLLTRISQQSEQLVASEAKQTSAFAIAASPGSAQIAALSSPAAGQTLLSLLNPQSGFAVVKSLTLDGTASSVTLSHNGKFAYVVMTAGGVLAVNLQSETLSLAAILHEAVLPISASSSDGRLVTGSNRIARELITWDTNQWLPVGRIQLPPAGTATSISAVATDRKGDKLLAVTSAGMYSVNLAVPAPRRVIVNADDPLRQNVRIGVRNTAHNSAPSVGQLAVRDVNEDSSDSLAALLTSVTDADGDSLWFTLETPPQFGRVVSSATGQWTYIPNLNFSGLDSAKFLVYDGQTSSELVLQWNVLPVNDSPTAFSASGLVLRENAQHGTVAGSLVLVDPDTDARYVFSTSDSRFDVINGRLVFVAGGLDFEAEPSIRVDITATDYYDPSIRISTTATIAVLDVNEGPSSIQLSNRTVENIPGALVGQLSIVDPDTNSDYEFFVFDPRFAIVGNQLRLAAGVSLDLQSESDIELAIAATDGDYELEELVTIHVQGSANTNLGITLSRKTVDERTLGASVGAVSVINGGSATFNIAVSDSRFEVVSGQLKLRSDRQLDAKSESEISFTLSATSSDGRSVSDSVTITVASKQSPYQNPDNPHDVNGDGVVSPIDVLIVINDLNLNGTHPVPVEGLGNGEPPTARPDVNGDGMITPIDVLLIINELNGRLGSRTYVPQNANGPLTPEGEGPSDDSGPRIISLPQVDSPEERRRRENSNIDAELELLLDQISRQRSI